MENLSRRRGRGFTMVELMFVIAILGIVIALTLPKLTGSSRRAIQDATARNISRLGAYARQVAVSTQQPVVMTFDSEGKKWYIDLPPDPDDKNAWRREGKRDKGDQDGMSDEEETHKLDASLKFAEFLVDGEQSKEKLHELTFYPNGTCTGVQIVLENTKGRRMTVEFERATGRAMAYAGEPKDLAAKLEEAGADPSNFAGLKPTEDGEKKGSTPGEGFYRSAGSKEDREQYYKDVAERIMGDAARKHSREKENEAARATGGNSTQREQGVKP